MRLAVTGRDQLKEKSPVKAAKVKNIPTASPPKRNKSPTEIEKINRLISENVTEANEDMSIEPFNTN